jgi:hypothetical protein
MNQAQAVVAPLCDPNFALAAALAEDTASWLRRI